MLKRESCVLEGIKEWRREAETGKKLENEDISLYATLQEPEFRCFTLNS
jgi:predicted transcriptional regulator